MTDSHSLRWFMTHGLSDREDSYDELMDWSRGDLVDLIFEMSEYVRMYKDLQK